MSTFIMIAFFCYFLTLAAISIIISYLQTSNKQFISGGKSINYWVTAIATQASDMGIWLFLGFPAAIYTNGLFEYWSAIGLIFFMFLTWHFIAYPLRIDSSKYNAVTLLDYFNKKYNDTQGHISTIGSIVILLFFTFYIASGLIGLGKLFNAAFGINYHTGICIGLSTVLLYALIGGFVAIAWCDFFQGLFLLAVIVITPLYVWHNSTGIDSIIIAAKIRNTSLSLFPENKNVFHALFLAASWGLGYFGQPHILVNFMAIDNPKNTKHALKVGMAWQIIVLSASAALGLVALGFYPAHYNGSGELLFIDMITHFFGPFITGLALCAVLAATLSTMDSHILVSGTTCAYDLFSKTALKKSGNYIVRISRIGSLVISLCALAIAWYNTAGVYTLVNYAWSGLGSAFGPLVIASLYQEKMVNKYSAQASIIIGTLVSAILPLLSNSILPLVPGFFAASFTLYLLKNK